LLGEAGRQGGAGSLTEQAGDTLSTSSQSLDMLEMVKTRLASSLLFTFGLLVGIINGVE